MKIRCTLSSLGDAADILQRYADQLENKSEKIIKKVLDAGAEVARLELKSGVYDFDSVDAFGTYESIATYQPGKLSGSISAGKDAVWIEFGTGVMSNWGSPHPKKAACGMVGWGEYGKGHGADVNGWYYPTYPGWKHTFGTTMNPFMYHASKYMKSQIVDIAREVFTDDRR